MIAPADSSDRGSPPWDSSRSATRLAGALMFGERAFMSVFSGNLVAARVDRDAGWPRASRWAQYQSLEGAHPIWSLECWLGFGPACGPGDEWELERLGALLGRWPSGRDATLRAAGRRLFWVDGGPNVEHVKRSRNVARVLHACQECVEGGSRGRECLRHALTRAVRAAAGEWRIGMADTLTVAQAERAARATEEQLSRLQRTCARNVRSAGRAG